jgi:linoleoyl-CoA desaturase
LVVEKLLGLGLVLGFAFLVRPWPAVVAGFEGAGLVGGLVLAVSFQIQHVVDTTAYPVADATDGSIGTEWARTQVAGAADVATGNRLYSWYVGGLNHHIEHHLFPRVGHVLLPAIAPLVRTACAEHGVTYTEFSTIAAAIAAHQRMLRRLGAPRSPVPATAPAVLIT